MGRSEFIDVVLEHKKLKTHIVHRNDAKILCSVYNEKNIVHKFYLKLV